MEKKQDWKSILKADPTEWLLEEENPVVHYWALRDISDASQETVEVARQRAVASEVPQELFRQQKPAGHWEKPDNMHAPHYTSTIYCLTLLGDLGLKADNECIANGIQAVLKTQRDDGGFPGHHPKKCEYGPYDIGLIIRFMHQFGIGNDPRVVRMYEWLERNQTSEGGWVGAKVHCNPTEGGCLNGTANILWGLATARQFAGTEIARKGLRFLTSSVASESRYGRQTSYPQFWNFWVDDIKLAEIYLGLGVRNDEEPLKKTLANVLSLQENEGRWLERRGPYPEPHRNCLQMRRFFPKKREPSKWITAKAMALLKNASTK